MAYSTPSSRPPPAVWPTRNTPKTASGSPSAKACGRRRTRSAPTATPSSTRRAATRPAFRHPHGGEDPLDHGAADQGGGRASDGGRGDRRAAVAVRRGEPVRRRPGSTTPAAGHRAWFEHIPPSERMSRAELQRIADMYFIGSNGTTGAASIRSPTSASASRTAFAPPAWRPRRPPARRLTPMLSARCRRGNSSRQGTSGSSTASANGAFR